MDQHQPSKRKRPRLPSSAFDPRFRELLLKAALEEVRIDGLTRREATTLRHRMSEYRFAMKLEQRSEWPQLYRSVITIQADGSSTSSCAVILRPRDSEFGSALDKATSRALGLAAPALTASDDPLAGFDLPAIDLEPHDE